MRIGEKLWELSHNSRSATDRPALIRKSNKSPAIGLWSVVVRTFESVIKTRQKILKVARQKIVVGRCLVIGLGPRLGAKIKAG